MLRSKTHSSLVNHLAGVGGVVFVLLLSLAVSANAQSTTDYFGTDLPSTGLMTLKGMKASNKQFQQQALQGSQIFPRGSAFASSGATGTAGNSTETTGTQTTQTQTDVLYTSRGPGNGASNPLNPYNLTTGPANKKFPNPKTSPNFAGTSWRFSWPAISRSEAANLTVRS